MGHTGIVRERKHTRSTHLPTIIIIIIAVMILIIVLMIVRMNSNNVDFLSVANKLGPMAPPSQQLSISAYNEDWVALEELTLSYYTGETSLLCTQYVYALW